MKGDCGESYIYIDDDGNGQAEMNFGLESTTGSILGGLASVNYTNLSSGGSASYLYVPTNNNPPSGWDDIDTFNTGTGNVSADLDGTVVTSNVRVCVINNPTDTELVT